MVRSYKQKNRYFKNSRLSDEQSEFLILAYLKGVKISKCADLLGRSKQSVSNLYQRLDELVFDGDNKGRALFHDFTQLLDDDEDSEADALRYMLYTVHGLLINLDAKGYTRDMRVQAGWDDFLWEETMRHTPHLLYHWGMWQEYPMQNHLESCIFTCSSDTPPLAVKEQIENGQRQKVIEKRIACKTCPIKLKQVYDPPWGKPSYPCNESSERSIVYEPYREYVNDVNEIIVFWIDVLWFLGHFRNITESVQGLKNKVMRGAYFSALKRSEFKVSENLIGGVGADVPTPFLYPEQIEDQKRGLRFVSQLDRPALNAFAKALDSRKKK